MNASDATRLNATERLVSADDLGQESAPSALTQARRLDFSDSLTTDGKVTRLSMRVPDIRCAACSLHIERHLGQLSQVVSVATNLADKRVVVDFVSHDAAVRNPDSALPGDDFIAFVEAVESLGFTPVPDRLNLAQAAISLERKSMLGRLGVAGIGMMQVMMFAFTGYLAGPAGIEPAYEGLMRWSSLLIATPIAAYSAMPFYRGAWRDLRHRQLGMDVPIAMAILAAYGLSAANTLLHQDAVYFDSVTMFTFLLLLGRYIELGSRQKYQLSQNLNDHLLPTTVLVEPADASATDEANKEGQIVALNAITVGAIVRVSAESVIPVDGIVLSGTSTVSEAAFTGESLSLAKLPGMPVLAGSQNLDAELLIECTAVYNDFVLSRISALYRQSSLYKPRFALIADRIARYFVGFILLVTLGSAVYWLQAGSSEWFSIALSVLVVSCPCALSLATPVAYTVAISALRQTGVVVRHGALLERLAEVDEMILDKTGTLTTGTITLVQVHLLASELSVGDARAIAAALERGSRHPIAHAFQTESEVRASDITINPGEGVSGIVDGQRYWLGRADYAGSPGLCPPSDAGIWVLLGADQPLAWFQLNDQPRPEAEAVVQRLWSAGLHLSILTGDAIGEARRLGEMLGIEEVHASMKPDAKVSVVRQRQNQGARVVMVGDGINDAAAMASAYASVAVSPVDVIVQEAADATLLNSNLTSLPVLVEFSKKVRRVIRQNISWALMYNGTVIPLAVAGMLHPWMAALGMSLSSLLVVLNANRLRTVRG
ncbi:MAG: Cu2+-exporting ATPase [Candidatus Azotimanducaceae bacterium]|jgi:Cu2+-exporting ATPase